MPEASTSACLPALSMTAASLPGAGHGSRALNTSTLVKEQIKLSSLVEPCTWPGETQDCLRRHAPLRHRQARLARRHSVAIPPAP
ncbi:hypothetical protein LY76DRAFT_592386 [Colletotrichum caudatum]|nr:hypothetical protein LY76DRAFT_592386 [Colletotrichum caudatum]